MRRARCSREPLKTLEAMLHQRLVSEVTYRGLASNGGKRQGPQSGSMIFEEMLHQGLLHNAITYSAVISACGKGITAV